MGSNVGIFWHGLRCGLGDGVGCGYGSVVGHGEVGCGEVHHGEVGHGLTTEVSGF